LRETWKSWQGSRDSDLDFFSSAVRSRGMACRPHVIVLNRGGKPDAMLVGLREHKTMPVKLGRITICQPRADVLEFVHGSVRGRASDENCAALVQQVVQSLNQGEADLAVWEQLGVDSPLYSCMLQLQHFPRGVRHPCRDDHWVMNFPKGLDAFLASLGRSQRSKLRRKYQKVLGRFAGRMRVVQFRTATDLEPAVSVMEQIASKSEKRRSGFGFFDTPQLREQMAIAAQEGWLRIYVLYLEDKPAAFWMGTLYERCLQADQVGYDPIWGEFSPGIFLFLNILESLRDADIDTVDFGRGSSQLKQCFAALRRVEACAHIYASTMRGLRLNLLSATSRRATILARRIYGIDGARKLLRNHFAGPRSEPELLGGAAATVRQ
jgi:Acetyltransferase (GNAT) domain